MATLNLTLSDTVTISQPDALGYEDILADKIWLFDPSNLIFDLVTWVAWSETLAQNTNVSEALKSDYGAPLADNVTTADVFGIGMRYDGPLVQNMTLVESLLASYTAVLGQNMTVSEALAASSVASLVEALGLTDVVLPLFKYGLTARDTIVLADTLANFFSGALVENVGVSESLTNQYRVAPEMVENVALTEALVQALVLRVEVADTALLDDLDFETLRYALTMTEGVEITAGYIGPNGQFTTWAINTKNFATTEYTNYAFNSFAQMGTKFIGATSSGLYELDGDTDDGAAIIADIKSGLMQLGGSRFTSFKAAYLGLRGSGDFVLRLVTGDGTTYNYAVVGKSVQTTRVHFGKGLRARYFSFELISTGQDFDLDTVEFIPLIAQRRG